MNVYGFEIESDFEIRKIRDIDGDVDMFVDIGGKTLNMDLECTGSPVVSRIQFCMVRGILLRISADQNICTVHVLKSIDLYSAISNFEVDFSDCVFRVEDRDSCVQLCINKKTVK